MQVNIHRIKLFIMILIIAVVIVYIDYNIKSGNPEFYSGKDNGAFRRFESIVILSTLFFLLMAGNQRILFVIAGFFGGIICSIAGYILAGLLPFDSPFGNVFHIVSCLLFIGLFYALRKLLPKKTYNARTD